MDQKIKSLVQWDNLPELKLQDRRGATDYIDFLEPAEVWRPCRGVDCASRPFVALPVSVWDDKDDTKSHHAVLTVFQRYSNNPNLWVVGTTWSEQRAVQLLTRPGSSIVDWDRLHTLWQEGVLSEPPVKVRLVQGPLT